MDWACSIDANQEMHIDFDSQNFWKVANLKTRGDKAPTTTERTQWKTCWNFYDQ
jgi:hypothetical protein